MSITTDNLAEFVDRLADLKRALAQLNDAGTADRHLIGLETVANAARAAALRDRRRLRRRRRSVDCLAPGPACVWNSLPESGCVVRQRLVPVCSVSLALIVYTAYSGGNVDPMLI